jgi:hypothetical protein
VLLAIDDDRRFALIAFDADFADARLQLLKRLVDRPSFRPASGCPEFIQELAIHLERFGIALELAQADRGVLERDLRRIKLA